MIYTTTIKKALLMLAPEHIGYCKSCSALIALYNRTGLAEREVNCRGKLQGYLTCLEHLGTISREESHYLNNWFSSADRSKEDL